MTKKQILKLRPEFEYGGMTMVDWFEITEGAGFFCIRSGLRHADLETKSPFYFPKNRRFTDKLHLTIWNCGTRPQTIIQKIKDTRITIIKNYKPIFIIKKGAV